ncbi:symmetrical bis(5'-nucleosyl)-tetraphosphatase [Buchnera aphidicola]|uniref:bis(5'-nucleosyl)-tetraphosphatase (symmetrical) n=1 Tax=Buchnera aphidicola (Therioaphis trifolii) TaxID=1241884 RepID=A0A4D6YAW8_9GAMM|nr:symmetrical bis(5'-nucleosyl)-tetraphosphatase [Buchnera aphidicola]QCI27106.1 symmetrical bis(5'-nucleosyl)-tetraphosphatase [Buchnera aphidicola (Therioaphis trifolii)]
MSTYLISDIHGCFKQLELLLKKVQFNSQYDILLVAGDLIGRGPNSLEVLLYLKSLGNNIKIVLGNHDLKALLIYYGFKKNNIQDNLDNLFKSQYVNQLMDWLRKQPVFYIDKNKKIIITHAGIYPYWNLKELKYFSKKIHLYLSSHNFLNFLKEIINFDSYTVWNKKLNIFDQLKFGINIFTKMRYLSYDKSLNLNYKDAPSYKSELKKLKPWFFFKNSINKKYSIFFGHWASLTGIINTYKNIVLLDSGCCWGKYLSIFRWDDKKWFKQK